jgi:outer membrane protein OmpA-like peptidoglycan-associated protein
MHPPLQVEVPRDSVDISGRTLDVLVDRNARGVKVDVIGPGGAVIGNGANTAGPFATGQRIPVTWTDSGEEVIQLQVVGTDVDGFWGQVDLSPWAYEVPHVDVVFESGQSIIRADEAPKLESALAEVHKIVEKYGSIATINLYVAGYTDTVGPAASNITLSRSRARAIAQWFQTHGFAHPIYFQGFGEQGLAVPTPDATDEAANRRAAYIIAAEAPPLGGAIPSRDWQRL